MKKISMSRVGLTFEDACEKHLNDCIERHLSESTIRHYRQGYTCFFRFFDPNMPVSKIDADAYSEFVRYLCNEYSNDMTINTYLRDFIVALRFLMDEGDV